VVDIYSDGDLECYGRLTRVNNDCWYRVSKWNVCRAFGMDLNDENVAPLTDEQILAQLKGKEFDCSLIVSSFIASRPIPAAENQWTLRDVDCKYCESKVCGCENYEPMETEHV
jgi:hypothetical protein